MDSRLRRSGPMPSSPHAPQLAAALFVSALAVFAALCCPQPVASWPAVFVQDTSAAAEPSDSALDKKVTISVEMASLEDFCKILEEVSGVDFGTRGVARDRKVTVFVRDRPLREVVHSIAEITHLYFARVKEGPGEGRYLFYEDDKRKAEREAARREIDKKRREDVRWMLDNWLAAAKLPPDSEEWDRIKQEAPGVWLAFRCKDLQEYFPHCIFELLGELPRGALEHSLSQGIAYRVRAGDLSPRAQELLPYVNVALDPFLDEPFPAEGEVPEVPWERLAEVEVEVSCDEKAERIGLELAPGNARNIMGRQDPADAREDRLAIAKLEEGMDYGKARSEAWKELDRESIEQREKQARETYADDPALMEILEKEGVWPAEELQGEISERAGQTWWRRRLQAILGMLSKEADLTIYAQHFTHSAGWWPVDPRDKVHGPFLSYLLKLEDSPGVQWELRDRVLLVTYPDWYERLEKETPERLLARWRKRIGENGRVDFDHFVEVCTLLSDEQIDALGDALHPGDEAAPSTPEDFLGWAVFSLSEEEQATLRFVGSLNEAQRKAAYSFLPFSDLAPAQREGFTRLAGKLAEGEPVEIDPVTGGLSIGHGYQEYLGPVVKMTVALSGERKYEERVHVDEPDESLMEKYKKESEGG